MLVTWVQVGRDTKEEASAMEKMSGDKETQMQQSCRNHCTWKA